MAAIISQKPKKLFGKIKVVYDNFGFQTEKVRHAYYSSDYKFYRNMIDYLYDILPIPNLAQYYNTVVPFVESLSKSDFELLCQLEQMGKLDALVKLIKQSAKTFE